MEFQKERGKSGKNQGLLLLCPNIKGLPVLRFNLTMPCSDKMLCQEVMESFVRSGRCQRKIREYINGKNWPHCTIVLDIPR